MKTLTILFFLIVLIITFPLGAQVHHAQSSDTSDQSVSRLISYQGILTDSNGEAVSDGEYIMSYNLYDSEAGTTVLWSETQTVPVNDGVFNVLLGSVNPFDIDFDTQLWLGITVAGGSELSPRLSLTSSAHSMCARAVEDGSITTTSIADEAVTGDKLHEDAIKAGENISLSRDAGNNFVISASVSGGGLTEVISDGTLAGAGISGNPLGLADNAITTTKIANAVVTSAKIANNSITSTKIQDGAVAASDLASNAVTTVKLHDGAVTKAKLSATGGSNGQVLKLSSGSLTWGNDNTGELTLPYSGTYSSGDNTDIFYIRNNGTGRSIHAVTESATAIWAETSSGFAGIDARNGSGYGVVGRSTSSHAVDGRSTSSYGIYGTSESGTAVFGRAMASSGATFGGYFQNDSPVGTGVYGKANTTTGTNFGVVGLTNSSDGYGGYFYGRVHVNGYLSKASGAFEIDHPLDPANKILRHSFVESPDMMNVYNGNIITDGNGSAVVVLPQYFEALNMDFRYQLTVIGEFAQAIIAEKISGNRFTIRTDKPNVEVSWQVTGVRKDAWAKENRIVVEEYKKPEARGYYLYPQLYGQPQTRSILWGENPGMMRMLQDARSQRATEDQSINE